MAALTFQLRRLLQPDLPHLWVPTSPKVSPPPAEWLSHIPSTSSWSIPATALWKSEPSRNCNCDAANGENGALATTTIKDGVAVAGTGWSQLRTNLASAEDEGRGSSGRLSTPKSCVNELTGRGGYQRRRRGDLVQLKVQRGQWPNCLTVATSRPGRGPFRLVVSDFRPKASSVLGTRRTRINCPVCIGGAQPIGRIHSHSQTLSARGGVVLDHRVPTESLFTNKAELMLPETWQKSGGFSVASVFLQKRKSGFRLWGEVEGRRH